MTDDRRHGTRRNQPHKALTPQQVTIVRNNPDALTWRELMALCGCSRDTLWKARTRQRYSDLP